MNRPIPTEVLADFRYGFQSERRLVEAIRYYLLTPEQEAIYREHQVNIEDTLNGRHDAAITPVFDRIRAEWNRTLGFRSFLEHAASDAAAVRDAIHRSFGQDVRFH